MDEFEIYQIQAGESPIFIAAFKTKGAALEWVKQQEHGEYALLSQNESGWGFIPVTER